MIFGLVFNISDGTTNRHSPPAGIVVLKKDNAGKLQTLDDLKYEPIDFFGGFYNSTEQSYSFNIPRHIQGLLKDTTADKTLYLNIRGYTYANRLVLNGTNDPTRPLKLKLTYTILD